MMLGFVLDLLVAGLLVATIGYCVVLNRKLNVLRDAQAEMNRTIQEFDRATAAARSSVIELRSVADKAGAELKDKIDRAVALSDELKFIAESGNRIAERLSDSMSGARKVAATPTPAGLTGVAAAAPRMPQTYTAAAAGADRPSGADRAPPADRSAGGDRRSEAERELMQALQRFK